MAPVTRIRMICSLRLVLSLEDKAPAEAVTPAGRPPSRRFKGLAPPGS